MVWGERVYCSRTIPSNIPGITKWLFSVIGRNVLTLEQVVHGELTLQLERLGYEAFICVRQECFFIDSRFVIVRIVVSFTSSLVETSHSQNKGTKARRVESRTKTIH